MPIDNTNKAIIAFKNLLGKSNTDVTKGVNNEFEGLLVNVLGSNVWTEDINSSPAQAVVDGVAVAVTADMVLDGTSNGHALFATWPVTPPSGTDPRTGAAFAYGTGSLLGISPGSRVTSAIPDTFGINYLAKPYEGANPIPVGDQRDWVYQYNSGIFFQEDGNNEAWGGSPYGHPDTIQLYVYIGNTIADVVSGGGSEWYASVKTIQLTPPVSPASGDRYLIGPGPSPAATGDWTGKEDVIAEWTGTAWLYTEPTQGGTVQVDDEPGVYYLYSGDDYPNGEWIQVPSTIVRIGNATGTDTYTGTVDPPITDYDKLVFIGTFENANTGASTLEINALGAKDIKKKDSGGSLVDLDANDIRAGIMYMLVYDGTVFQLYTGDLGTPLNEVLAKGNVTNGNDIILTTDDVIQIGSIAGNTLRYFSGSGNVQLTAGALLTDLDISATQNVNIVGNTGANIGVSSANINLSAIAMTVTDTANSKGLVYAADYSSNFTANSLVTKSYVDAAVSVEDLWDQVGNDIQTAGSFSPNTPNVLPRYDDQQDLGSKTKRWKDLYLGSVIDYTTDLTLRRDTVEMFNIDNEVAYFRSALDLDVTIVYPGFPARTASAVGTGSASWGFLNEVTGFNAFAIGGNNIAGGNYAFAYGELNEITTTYSQAFGYDNTINGTADVAFVQGQFNTVSAYLGFAQGLTNTVSGVGASAFGNLSVASDDYARAFGWTTTASAYAAFASGIQAEALGQGSHAFGNAARAGITNGGLVGSGRYSTAMGLYTEATGDQSFVGGYGWSSVIRNTTSGLGSFNWSRRTNLTTSPAVVGAAGEHSAILGGVDNSVTGDRSVVLGGNVLYGAADDTVYVPNLEIQGNVLAKYTVQPDTQGGWDDLSIPTKKYVDDQVGAADTLAEVLALGNTTGGTNIELSNGDAVVSTSGDNALYMNGNVIELVADYSNYDAGFYANSNLKYSAMFFDGWSSAIEGGMNGGTDPVGSYMYAYTAGAGSRSVSTLFISDSAPKNIEHSVIALMDNTVESTFSSSVTAFTNNKNILMLSDQSGITGGGINKMSSMLSSSNVTLDNTNHVSVIAASDVTANSGLTHSVIMAASNIANTAQTYSAAIAADDITIKASYALYTNQLRITLAASDYDGIFTTAALTADRTYTFQDKSGTVAFLSDVNAENLWDLTVGGDLETSSGNSPDIPNVLPRFNDTQDLGSSSKRWKDLYLGSVIDFATTLDFALTGATTATIDGSGLTMAAGKVIDTANGGGQIKLDESTDEVLITNDSGAYGDSGLYLSSGYLSLFGNGWNGAFEVGQLSATNTYWAAYTTDAMIMVRDSGSIFAIKPGLILGVTGGAGDSLSNGASTLNEGVGFFLGGTNGTISGQTEHCGIIAANGGNIATGTTTSVLLGGTGNQVGSGGVADTVVLGGIGITAGKSQHAYVQNLGYYTNAGLNQWTTTINHTAATADRTQTFQDADGTIALTSDITAAVSNTKYVELFAPGTVGVANVITHNLGDVDVIVQLWYNNKLITADTVEVIDSNTVHVTFTGSNPSGEVSPDVVKIVVKK